MKFYSEQLKRFFDTEEQCLAEEEKAKTAIETTKQTKAKLAKAIENADKELDDAYAALTAAEKQVEELQNEYDQRVADIMDPARERIRECTRKRAEAIKEFNEKYGVYTTTYTGNKALNELMRADKIIDDIFKRFYW